MFIKKIFVAAYCVLLVNWVFAEQVESLDEMLGIEVVGEDRLEEKDDVDVDQETKRLLREESTSDVCEKLVNQMRDAGDAILDNTGEETQREQAAIILLLDQIIAQINSQQQILSSSSQGQVNQEMEVDNQTKQNSEKSKGKEQGNMNLNSTSEDEASGANVKEGGDIIHSN